MSRELILERIRAALNTAESDAATNAAPFAYERTTGKTRAEIVSLFAHRLAEYGARVYFTHPDQIQQTIASALIQPRRSRMLVPVAIDKGWLAPGVQWLTDEALPFTELDKADGVLTAATCAVAESGSIVLQHGPQEGRRALTLLPDYHLCVLYEEQIVATLPEAIAKLRPTATLPTTFISGPSATADIEMTRIQGVHGPRSLDVCIVRSPSQQD